MPRPSVQELIARRVVVFDGAMGTELYLRHQFVNVCYDHLCITRPELVTDVHSAHKRAGADVLTTNSFGANRIKLTGFLLTDKTREITRAAASIAREAAGDDLLVAGSVGPLGQIVGLGGISEADAVDAFDEAVSGLKEGGADFIILETFSRRAEMLAAARAAARNDMPYIPSMSFNENGLTRFGETIEDFFAPFPSDLPLPAMIGFNCSVGPSQMLEHLQRFIPSSPFPVLVQPNAGLPRLVSDRTIYMTSPEYLMTYAKLFVEIGARAVGGCCGTGPQHIKELATGLKSLHRHRIEVEEIGRRETVPLQEPIPTGNKSRFGRKIAGREWATSVEIVPPMGWDLKSMIAGAKECRDARVDAINVPDGPRASCRISPMIAAMSLQNEAGIEAVLHVACRDRNVIGMQSDLLGCAAVGIRNLLIVTGDPPKIGNYPFASAVFDVDSIGMTKIASRMNRGVDIGGQAVKPPTSFLLGVGADPSHIDQDRETDRLRQKMEAGAEFAITQPVFDAAVLEKFIERVKDLGLPIIAGIWPLASLRNAEFMKNEVPGVVVPEWIIRRMAGCKTKESARDEGVAIAREILEQVRPLISGVQVSAPFGNVKTALAVLS